MENKELAAVKLTQTILNSFPEKLSPKHIESKILAPVFATIVVHRLQTQKEFSKIRNQLLDYTVRKAVNNTNYYAEKIPNISDCWDYDSLKNIPTVDRETAFVRREDMLSKCTNFSFASRTSGTTGLPLLIERSTEEQQFLDNFFRYILYPIHKSNKIKPLGIRVADNSHGNVTRTPSFCYYFLLNLFTINDYEHATWLLENTFNIDGHQQYVSSIQSYFSSLYRFAVYLNTVNSKPPTLQIRDITSYGSPILLNRRQYIANTFGIRMQDNYSLAEIFGGARYCYTCNGYHFEPYVVPEVLDIHTGIRVLQGQGELVLTPLFPFTQRFVLIRYRTGDLVEIKPSNCKYGLELFTFAGRISNSIELGKTGIFIGPIVVAEALDSIADIANPAKYDFENRGSDWPHFKLESLTRCGGLLVQVEVYFNPKMEQHRAKRVIDKIREVIIAKLPVNARDWFLEENSRMQIELYDTNKTSLISHWKH